MSATESDETQAPTEEPQPLYGCQASAYCPEDNGVCLPGELRVWQGKTVCVHCFDARAFEGAIMDIEEWFDLPPFVPAHERRIVLLESSLRDMCRGAGMSDGLIADLLRACAAEDDKAGEGG